MQFFKLTIKGVRRGVFGEIWGRFRLPAVGGMVAGDGGKRGLRGGRLRRHAPLNDCYGVHHSVASEVKQRNLFHSPLLCHLAPHHSAANEVPRRNLRLISTRSHYVIQPLPFSPCLPTILVSRKNRFPSPVLSILGFWH